MQPFTTQIRVRHYEMDALGHVNNAIYQNYLEQAAVEHSEHLGLTLELYRKLGGIFVLRRLEIGRCIVAGWFNKGEGLTRISNNAAASELSSATSSSI